MNEEDQRKVFTNSNNNHRYEQRSNGAKSVSRNREFVTSVRIFPHFTEP